MNLSCLLKIAVTLRRFFASLLWLILSGLKVENMHFPLPCRLCASLRMNGKRNLVWRLHAPRWASHSIDELHCAGNCCCYCPSSCCCCSCCGGSCGSSNGSGLHIITVPTPLSSHEFIIWAGASEYGHCWTPVPCTWRAWRWSRFTIPGPQQVFLCLKGACLRFIKSVL